MPEAVSPLITRHKTRVERFAAIKINEYEELHVVQ